MATSIFTSRYRKALAAVGFGVRPAEGTLDSAVPLIQAGAGAASAANPNGSLRLRTDGVLEYRVGSSWEALAVVGQTPDFSTTGIKADVLAESTAGAGILVDGYLIQDSLPREYKTRWHEHEDFLAMAGTEADTGFTWNSGGDAQALDPAIDTAQAGGVFQCVTGNADGAVANDGSQMVWTGCPIQLDSAGGTVAVECRLRIKSAITTVSVNFGLTDATGLEEPFTGATDTLTSVATDACCFVFDSANTTQEWFAAAVDTDTDDTGNSATGSAPVADTFQILRMEIENDGATIVFKVDGTTVKTLSGAAGVGADVVLYPTVVANATTTTSRTVDVDWLRVEGVR